MKGFGGGSSRDGVSGSPQVLPNLSTWLLGCAMAWWTSSLSAGGCAGEGGSATVYGEQWCCRTQVSPAVYWRFPHPALHLQHFF